MKVKNTLTNFLNEYVALILIACTNKLFPRLFTFESLIKHDYHDSLVLSTEKKSNQIKQILKKTTFSKTQATNINWVVPFSKTFER